MPVLIECFVVECLCCQEDGDYKTCASWERQGAHHLQSGKTYSVQELAELLHKDVGSIQVELEYLENQGYIRKVAYQADCNHNCNGCHGCDQPTPAAPDVNIWEVIKRTE